LVIYKEFTFALLKPTLARNCFVRQEKFDHPQCMRTRPAPYSPTDEIY
jgi:hypothetical protein